MHKHCVAKRGGHTSHVANIAGMSVKVRDGRGYADTAGCIKDSSVRHGKWQYIYSTQPDFLNIKYPHLPAKKNNGWKNSIQSIYLQYLPYHTLFTALFYVFENTNSSLNHFTYIFPASPMILYDCHKMIHW